MYNELIEMENKMEVKAVIFDYGKVLTFPQPETEINVMCNLLNVSKDEFISAYSFHRDLYDSGNINGDNYWKNVSETLKVSIDKETISNLITHDVNSWLHLNNEAWKLTLKLRKKYKTALLTNNVNELCARMENEIPLEKYFDVSIFSNKLHSIKPDPYIYQYCLEKLQVEPSESIFIDDKIRNIEGAKNLGIKTILFTEYDKFLNNLEVLLGEKL